MKRRRYIQTGGSLFGASLLAGCPTESPSRQISTPTSAEDANVERIEAIRYEGHDIPLEEVHAITGSECDGEHYHAATGSSVVTTLCDVLPDPGGCGFGKVSETPVRDAVQFDYPCEDA